jgi:hypothetical protein
MQDPNLAVPPDFASQEFEEDREPLVTAGLTEPQAAGILARQWAVKNNRDKQAWTRRQREAAIAAAEEEEREEQNRQQQEEEAAQILKDKWKKNKVKYAPIPNTPVPSEPSPLRSQSGKFNNTNFVNCGISPTTVWTMWTLHSLMPSTMIISPSSLPQMAFPLLYLPLLRATNQTWCRTKTSHLNSSANLRYA